MTDMYDMERVTSRKEHASYKLSRGITCGQTTDMWVNQDRTCAPIGNRHVVEQGKDTWTNRKLTRGQTRKEQVDK
jgi:hypothetical protein